MLIHAALPTSLYPKAMAADIMIGQHGRLVHEVILAYLWAEGDSQLLILHLSSPRNY